MNQINDNFYKLREYYEGKGGYNKNKDRWYPFLDPCSIATIGRGHVICENGHYVTMERAKELYPNGLSTSEVNALDSLEYARQTRAECDRLGLQFDDNNSWFVCFR